jgi:hypothetical protein
MISGIKCRGKIKKTQARNLLLATGSDEIIIIVSIRRLTDKFGHISKSCWTKDVKTKRNVMAWYMRRSRVGI